MVKFSYLIKNKKKYKNIKLAKGINLQDFITKIRTGETGISSVPFGKVWFITPKGEALFKTYDGNMSKIRVLNELLYCNLAKRHGVKVAEYEAAHNEKQVGLVSYNFVTKNKQLVSIQEMYGKIVYDITYQGLIDHFNLIKSNTDIDKLAFDLFKLMVLDSLTFQEDRHNNLNFLYDRQNKTYELAPVVDNELAFGGSTMCIALEQKELLGTSGFLFDHGQNMHFFCNDECILVDYQKIYKKDVEQIVLLAQTKPTYMEYLKQTLKHFDIKNSIREIEHLGYYITPSYKEYLITLNGLAKQAYNQAITKYTQTTEKHEDNSADIYASR